MKVHKVFFYLEILIIALFLSAASAYSYTINATFGAGGSISPSGVVTGADGTDRTFTITPDTEHGVSEITVNGNPIDRTLSYTFTNVSGDNNTFDVSFFDCFQNPVMLDSDESLYGSITEAYDYAAFSMGLTDFTLKLRDGFYFTFPESLTFDAEAAVVLDGGYDCSFLDNSEITKISGPITIVSGTVTTSKISITEGLSCDGTDPDNLPGNNESDYGCNGVDNNCNGLIDEGLSTDADGDGHYSFGSCLTPNDDCDDNDSNNFPGNQEICDGKDNDCDGLIDEGLTATDADGDGYSAIGSCGGTANDCNDGNPAIHPGAPEIYGDGIDQDCSGKDLLLTSETTCFGCHDVGWTNDRHSAVTTPNSDPTCVGCHAIPVSNVLPGHYGKTVRTAGNNMAEGSVIYCRSCHDRHPTSDYTIPGAYIVWAKVDAAYNHVPPLPVTCDTCHENRAAAHDAAHDNRVITEVCSHCHTSDTSTLGMPGSGTLTSQSDVDTLHRSDCTTCHGYTAPGSGNSPDPAVVAQAIENGLSGAQTDCMLCHGAAFPTIHAFLEGHYDLVQVGTTSCGNCHSDTPPLVDPGDPKAHQDCTNCHDANFNTISLAAGKPFAAGGDCTPCHTAPFDTVHPDSIDHTAIINVRSTSCGNCHANQPPLVDLNDPKVHDGCASCHDSQGGLISLAAGKSFAAGGDCSTCHTDPFATVHPDNIDHSAIVTTAGTQCGTCHTSILLVDLNDPKVHNGCSTCHDVNGGLINLAAGKSFAAGGNCSTCHGADFTVIHPDNIDHTAIVNVRSTSCGNCHANQPPLVDLNDPKVHDGCFNCHDSNGGLVSLAVGKSFATGGDCTSCHTDPFGTIHPDSIDHSAIVTIGSTGCGSCHSDPPPLVDGVGTDDPKLHDGCFNCHDSGGGLISLAAGKSFATGGDCTTCHIDPFGTIHPDNIDHSAIVTVGTTSCGNCHSDPPPLVDAVGTDDPKLHNGCSSCHNSEGVLISYANGKSFAAGGDCTTCHIDSFGIIHPADVDHGQAIQLSTNCAGCHSAPPPLVDAVGTDDPKLHDGCSSCHDDNGGLINLAAGNPAPNECTTCHGNDLSTLHPGSSATHVATLLGVQDVLVFAADTHDSAMYGDGTVNMACSTCHSTSLGDIHDNNCATCHGGSPSKYDSLNGFWLGGCQQGACHTTYHSEVSNKHNKVTDYAGESNCTECHGQYWQDFPPLPTACANCHATYNLNDSIAPVTTSDAKASYIIPALIKFTVTDNGGLVGLGTTYYILDSGPTVVGKSVLVTTLGSHHLEFWSVDQAGNEELPHKSADFTIIADTTPPSTTSDAKPNYETAAVITLTANDDNPVDLKTYYKINNGSRQTGNSVNIPELNGNFTYTLEFWSVDWTGNEELPHNTATFTIYGGTGTIRLVWGDSDVSGSPCPGDPEAYAYWEIRYGGLYPNETIYGEASCDNDPNSSWSGVDDIVVPVSQTPYYVDVWWYDSGTGYEEQWGYPNKLVTAHGQTVTVHY